MVIHEKEVMERRVGLVMPREGDGDDDDEGW